jgi:hypothetical protein
MAEQISGIPASAAPDRQVTKSKSQTAMDTGKVSSVAYTPASSSSAGSGPRVLTLLHRTNSGSDSDWRIVAHKIVTSFSGSAVTLTVASDGLNTHSGATFVWVSLPQGGGFDDPGGTVDIGFS